MSVVRLGRLQVTTYVDGPRRGDRCLGCGAKIQPNWRLIALVLKDLFDSSRVMKKLSFPHFITCARCKKLLPIKSEIVIMGAEKT
ncbi:MAG: hypothetical protein QXG35_09880 [Nitrososphaerota archaeon]